MQTPESFTEAWDMISERLEDPSSKTGMRQEDRRLLENVLSCLSELSELMEFDDEEDVCAECARSHGPNYSGNCEH